MKDDYSDGAWRDVSSGDAVYGIPVDGGPMGMIYRKDIFEQYGIATPTTWAEYAAAAQAEGCRRPGSSATSGPTAARSTRRSSPRTARSRSPTTGQADRHRHRRQRRRFQGGARLLGRARRRKGLVGTDDPFTADYNTRLVDGNYAIYLAAAWAPGYLQGLSDADESAEWRAAPLPQWDAGNPV